MHVTSGDGLVFMFHTLEVQHVLTCLRWLRKVNVSQLPKTHANN